MGIEAEAKAVGLGVLEVLIYIGVGIVIVLVLLKLKRLFFKRAQERNQGLHLLFFERITTVIIVITGIVITLSMFGGFDSIWQTLLGGTAVTSAVVAFAAQDVIKDVLGGMMISIHKPFEKGSRIELEDGTAGVIEDMNTRHVVIKKVDSVRVVIPNSKIAGMRIINYSFDREDKCVHFRFGIGYDSDIEKAKKVIAEAIEQSEYTIPGKENEDGTKEYTPVYFMEFAESSLIMAVTVYFSPDCPTEIVKNDVNTRVREALVNNGIDIPYPHVSVIKKEPYRVDRGEARSEQ